MDAVGPGDMQFVYNHNLLHDRTEFIDWPDPDKRRHLLRLWLALPTDQPLPGRLHSAMALLKLEFVEVLRPKTVQVPLDA